MLRQKNGCERQAAERVGEIPSPPVLPILCRVAIAQSRLKPGSERHECRVHDYGCEEIQGRVSEAAEPWRTAQEPAQGNRIQIGDGDVAEKGGKKLQNRHRRAPLRQYMGWKRGHDVERPLPPGQQQQRAEEDDVGRPERGELLSKRADRKRRLGSKVIDYR